MLNVYLTIDVEIWSPGWKLDEYSLKKAYETYILGKTSTGNFGLEYQLDILNDAGLTAVCFIEPLFTKAAGTEYLRQVVKICERRNNEIQLHAHPEWLKHGAPNFKGIDFSNRYLLSEFSLEEQFEIINESKNILASVTDTNVTAFRAGSFAANAATLEALHKIGILLDSSFNPSMQLPNHGFNYRNHSTNATFQQSGVTEIPMTVFKTYTNKLRHTQLAACTFKEIKSLLLKSYHSGYKDFVILSHSAELLDSTRTRKDARNIETLINTAEFLAKNEDKFRCTGFRERVASEETNEYKKEPVKLDITYSMHRAIEKTIRLMQSKF